MINAVVPFNTNTTAIVNAVNQMPYLSRGTDTGDALNNASDIFSRYGRDPTNGYPWVAVLVTDGQPNAGPNPIDAAENLKSMGVTLFVVGVGQENLTNLQITGEDNIPFNLNSSI